MSRDLSNCRHWLPGLVALRRARGGFGGYAFHPACWLLASERLVWTPSFMLPGSLFSCWGTSLGQTGLIVGDVFSSHGVQVVALVLEHAH